ncbi:fatty acid transporter [Thiosulfatimonas sediminis]|uniref:Fatty acid transporter n=1 Tax=Thiosulfatimonas sediminis TaxID=2675054 RepID=A0A6F8PTF8_9GAMM|nr:outer membrane protein transport protein [Thiosulfatimonas sediminis]BBP45317.1 fatty acid transporter [Thiosulfatimonas sediminis]
MRVSHTKLLWAALSFAPLSVSASGFALIEQSASGQGVSYAGAAASAEDASIMWFNPAGLTKIKSNQLIAAGHVIVPSAEFTNNGSYILSEDNLIVGDADNGAKTSFVPNFYWKGKYQDIDVGLGVNVPFGSSIDYDQDWVGRYHAVYTSTKTININPAFAVKLHPQVSFGAGLNIQYIDVNLTQKVDLGDQQNDGYVDLQADGVGFGFNFGFLYDLDNGANIGFSYRSQIKHHATGDADFTAMPFEDQGIESTVTLPASASLSLVYPFNDKMNLLADATWTGWSSFDELRIEFDNKEDSVQPEEWKDVMRYSVGATYQYSPQWILRTGVAYDQTPIPNAELRTPRIPDSDRVWLSFGAGYQWNKDLRIDFAYSHLWGGTEQIEAVSADTGVHVLQGSFDTKVDIVSAQLVWNY